MVWAHPEGPLWFWPLQERARDSAATRGPPHTASGWGTASARAACCASAARRATCSGDRPSAPARATARGAAHSLSAEVTSVGPRTSPCPHAPQLPSHPHWTPARSRRWSLAPPREGPRRDPEPCLLTHLSVPQRCCVPRCSGDQAHGGMADTPRTLALSRKGRDCRASSQSAKRNTNLIFKSP